MTLQGAQWGKNKMPVLGLSTLKKILDLFLGSEPKAEEKENLSVTWRGFWNQVHGQEIAMTSAFLIHLDSKHFKHFGENNENMLCLTKLTVPRSS